MVFATLKASASNAVPSVAIITTPPIKPVIREIIVPTAITLDARNNSCSFTYAPSALVAHSGQSRPGIKVLPLP